MILLAFGVGGLLSSCHIKQEDVETISRTTEYLRVYQPNDFIQYNVTAITNSDTTSQGTLRVEWTQNDNLADPVDSSITYPVLKETTTLTYEAGSTEANVTIIRYISQDSSGTVTLYAIGGGTDLYWLHDPTDSGNLSANIVTPVIFDSRMKVGEPPPNTSLSSPVNFTVMDGCAPGTTCDSEIYTFTDGFTIVGDTTAVTTNLGKFSNPFEIDFSGSSIADDAATVSVPGDIRNACGTSTDNITHRGTMFVMPSIGIVRMTNLCQNSGGDRVDYIITISDTSISLPTPTP